jgi:hypothetical protein
MRWPIRIIGLDHESGLESLGIAAAPEGPALIFQRADDYDEQDRRLGQDTYCICDEAANVHYGGVVAWSLAGGMLRIELDPVAAEVFGDARFELPLETDPGGLEADLRRILES